VVIELVEMLPSDHIKSNLLCGANLLRRDKSISWIVPTIIISYWTHKRNVRSGKD